jgi:Holliday junction resolvase RusA-like endonuclease
VLSARVMATPSSASRPRVGKFGTYYAKAYSIWKAECQRQIAAGASMEPFSTQRLVTYVETVVERPKTTKLEMPKPDVDNLVKGVLDGATQAGVWGDDSQVQVLIAVKRWANPGEEPGAIIHTGALA